MWPSGTTKRSPLCPSHSSPITAAACIPTSRFGKAINRFSPATVTRDCPTLRFFSAANPYLAFAALLLAGLDGIQSRIDPGDPLDKNLYDLPPEELANVPSVPDSLSGAIAALEKDHDFLLKGDVFNSDFITNWLEM